MPGTGRFRLISLNESYMPYEIEEGQLQELWEVSSKITFGVDATTDSGLLRQLQQSMEELKKKLSGD